MRAVKEAAGSANVFWRAAGATVRIVQRVTHLRGFLCRSTKCWIKGLLYFASARYLTCEAGTA